MKDNESEIELFNFLNGTYEESRTLYNGVFEISHADDTVSVEGKVSYDMTPHPRITFDGDVIQNHEFIDGWGIFSKSLCLKCPNGLKGEVLVTNVDIGNGKSISGIIKNSIENSIHFEFNKLNFNVTNFVGNYGRTIAIEKLKYSGRLVFIYRNYKITLDKLSDFKERQDYLRKTSSFLTTHVGVIEKTDSKSLLVEETEELIGELKWLLSFACGRQISINYLRGLQGKEVVFDRYQTPIVSRWSEKYNWFPINQKSIDLEQLFPDLVSKLRDELWGKPLRNILTWYFESKSNANTYIETKIVSVQIALETLAWTFLVEDRKVLSRTQYKGMKASETIRKLLIECCIPIDIPSFKPLNNIQGYDDGLHLFTNVRNNIVHPKKENNVNSVSSYYVLQLGIQYLELVILNILNYQGSYYNQLKDGDWIGETLEYVPWAQVNAVKPPIVE